MATQHTGFNHLSTLLRENPSNAEIIKLVAQIVITATGDHKVMV